MISECDILTLYPCDIDSNSDKQKLLQAAYIDPKLLLLTVS